MDAISLPSRQSVITIQDITLANWEQVTRLVVNRDQLDLIVPNLSSLCEHQFHSPRSIVRAIVADNSTPVGYIRLQLESQGPHARDETQSSPSSPSFPPSSPSSFLLLSFMIHQACQGLGFGTKAMRLLQSEMLDWKDTPHQLKVLTKPFASVHPEDSPEHFFAAFGFQKNKKPDLQEMIWTPPPS